MNFYLRAKNTAIPCEIDADSLKYWLNRALTPAPSGPANLAAFLPKNGRAGIIEPATATRLLKVISAFAMEDDEADENLTLAASKLFQACRNPPLTVSEK